MFVEQLAWLCREHVTRNKWVFVPTHAIGRTLGERIALSGTNWLNLRFVTPLDSRDHDATAVGLQAVASSQSSGGYGGDA